MNTSSVLAIAVIFSIGTNGALAQIVPPADGGSINPDQVTIEWPSPTGDYPTLQSAVDALPDEGGVIEVARGLHQIADPVFITTAGQIVIQGAGCDELAKDPNRGRVFTHLQGPATEEIVEFEDAVGLFNQVSGGLVLRDLKVSGFDAGIVHKNSAVPNLPGAIGVDTEVGPLLSIEDVCITDTVRGVVSTASAAIAINKAIIRDVLWNGISLDPGEPPKFGGIFDAFGVTIVQARNACIVIKNAYAYFDELQCIGVGTNSGNFGFGDGGGMYVENSVITLNDVRILNSGRPGIVVRGGVTNITGLSLVKNTVGIGVFFYKPVSAYVHSLNIENTDMFMSGPLAGTFGDGLVVAGRAEGNSSSLGLVQLYGVPVGDSDRAALANFGGRVSISNSVFACAAFEISGEPYAGNSFQYQDQGQNLCGCPPQNDPYGKCVAVSVNLQAPSGPGGQN